MRYYETGRECIDYFREEYEFLSNFYPACLEFEGTLYLNSEAAYQAQKCANAADRAQFSRMSADEAKRLGGKIEVRSDWEQVKLSVMEAVVYAKFAQNPYLAEYLLATGDMELKEGNTWGDVYWGINLRTGEGENHLGQILMALRSRFREEGIPTGVTINRRAFGPIGGISVEFGDITETDCACIVNAANNTLLGGGGVDGAIHRAAGKELLEACRVFNGCPTGEARITSGYRLKANYVIHAVGPRYGEKDDKTLLRSAYINSLRLARENGIESIAFPAISTGKFSYPKEAATRIAVEAVRAWQHENAAYPLRIAFVCVDARIYDLFCAHIQEIR